MGKGQWIQWRGTDEFREQMDRMLEAARQEPSQSGALGTGYVWVPLADVIETAQAFLARLELPGVAPEQVLVELAEGALIVRGERPPEHEEADTAYHLMERAHGTFARRFPLPADADGEGISAVLREGVLTITVPKRRPAIPARRCLIVD